MPGQDRGDRLAGGAPPLVVLAAGRARRFGACKPLAAVGPRGRALVDVLAGDAVEAGFRRIVLVVNPETGPMLREHVRRRWPAQLSVGFAEQAAPRGTVDALLAARGVLGPGTPFAVANADDCYGAEALALLAGTLAGGCRRPGGVPEGGEPDHVMVGYHLGRTLLGDGPVNRGICAVDRDGMLVRVDERRSVRRDARTGQVSSGDGCEPSLLDAGAVTAVNLWGFQPGIWPLFEREQADRDARAAGSAGGEVPELLIPEVVGRALATSPPAVRVRVEVSDGECLGVTHPGDLELVRAALAARRLPRRRPAGRSAVARAAAAS